MAEEIPKPQIALDAAGSAIVDGVYEQVTGMLSALWASRERNKILALGMALTAVVGATAYAQVRLNAWNQPFYNALAHKDLSEFVQQLGVFAMLAGALLILNVAQMWLNQTSKVVLRRGLVDDLMTQWMAPSRAFRLSNAGEIGANPDQRIQQDAGHLTDLTTDLGIGLLQSTLLLLSFIGVLWILSDRMVLTFNGHSLVLPGYMVWCALTYSVVASFVSWRVGRPLIDLNAEHYAREADFRVAVVRVNEAIDGITLYEGEPDERRRLGAVFESVLGVSRRIVGAVTRLTWVTAGYGWFTIAAPILVAAPAYFRSEMSFGELMMIVGAFNQVQQALRWFVDNFSSIADWRATLLRVASFRKAVLAMDELGHSTSRINFEEGESESILLDKLKVAAHDVCIRLGEPSAELKPTERVLVSGDTGESRALFFRAIGGLWPWGSGRITYPARRHIMFVPIRAYVPPGSLREAVAYPHSCDKFENEAIDKAIASVGLGHLTPPSEGPERWDHWLTDEEKQRLAIARIILHRPRWVVVNDALDMLDPEWRQRIAAMLKDELSDIGVINIGRERFEAGMFSRTLRLMIDPHGPTMTRGGDSSASGASPENLSAK
ncbi:MAG: ABC transporter ATP-binding protein/permease [Roseiarcus sp.]|uniref:ABC transporter ATP-binding protein/permease n=1 Tax=Roseiarcus sp. TaxID=1969460 RepID=UPI003BB0D0A8